MSNNTNKQKNIPNIPITTLSHTLGVLEADLIAWVRRDKQIITLDSMGRECVPKTLLEKYSRDSEYTKAFNKGIVTEIKARSIIEKQYPKFKKKRLELLVLYNKYINSLETIHKKYLDKINAIGNESNIMAAYLLFSRVISTLKMFCLCMENNYWYSGSLLREIDESLFLAETFVTDKDNPKTKEALHKWFRENNAPSNSVCRKLLAKKMSSADVTFKEEENKSIMDEIYDKKSKFTHPTYNVIKEITKYKITPNEIPVIEELTYGPCNNEEKLLELTVLFKSSIWTTVQSFLFCFHNLPLKEDDRKDLKDLNKKFDMNS
jgi:hypothetical protein